MPNRKITAFTSAASAQASTIYPIVSGGNANKIVTQHTMLQSLGIAQYVEATCRATTTVANLPRCNIFDIYIRALAGSSANVGGSQVEYGRGTDSLHFGNAATSGVGFYRDAVSFNLQGRFINTSGAVVAAAPTATAAANFVVGIGYFRT